MKYPQRVHPRLKNYDYATSGAYHIIICTKGRQHILSRIVVGRAALCAPQVQLTSIGEVARKYIERIPIVYETVFVDRYIIMPDHIHLLLRIDAYGAQGAARPTVEQVVRSLKIMVRKAIGRSVFQSSFYDHVIRGKQDYDETWSYIDNNPARWIEQRRKRRVSRWPIDR